MSLNAELLQWQNFVSKLLSNQYASDGVFAQVGVRTLPGQGPPRDWTMSARLNLYLIFTAAASDDHLSMSTENDGPSDFV